MKKRYPSMRVDPEFKSLCEELKTNYKPKGGNVRITREIAEQYKGSRKLKKELRGFNFRV